MNILNNLVANMMTDVELVLKEIPSPTVREIEIIDLRLGARIETHLIIDELLVRREEKLSEDDLHRKDLRSDELIRGLKNAGVLDDIHYDEYLSAISQARAGAVIQDLVNMLVANVQARKAAALVSGAATVPKKD